MLNQLRLQSDVIALEALAGNQALTQALTRLPLFLSDTKSFLNSYLAAPIKELFVKKDINWLALKIQRVNYATIRNQEMIVPPGMTSDYLTYAEALDAAVTAAAKLRIDVLNPYQRWLGQLLGNPAELTNMREGDVASGVKKSPVDSLLSKIHDCFNIKSTDMVRTYGQAIRRNADWTPLASLSLAIQANALSDDHLAIVRQVNDISDMMDRLLSRLQENKDEYKVSGPVLAALANTAYLVAKHIEFYGMMRHRVVEYNHALQQTIDRVKKLLG